MIEFGCKSCGKQFAVPDEFAGKNSKCPKCGQAIVIPKTSEEIISFRCLTCNQRIGINKEFAGKSVRCGKCKNVMRVPEISERPDRVGIEDQTVTPISGQIELELEEQPLRLRPIPEGASLPRTVPAAMVDKLTADANEKPPRKNPSVIMIAAICIVGFLPVALAVWCILSSVSGVEKIKSDENNPEVQKFAEQYITLLADGEIDKAAEVVSRASAGDDLKGELGKIAGQIGKNNITRVDCMDTFNKKQSEGNQFVLFYNVYYKDARQFVAVVVLENNEKLTVDGIAAQNPRGDAISIGPATYKELSDMFTAVTLQRVAGFVNKFLLPFLLVSLVIGLIQTVSMWIVFKKAGQHGWAAIVPFYNMWVLAEVGDKPGWLGLVMCFCGLVPLVGPVAEFVLWVIISIGVARAFDHGIGFGIGLTLLPFIFYPILAFAYD